MANPLNLFDLIDMATDAEIAEVQNAIRIKKSSAKTRGERGTNPRVRNRAKILKKNGFLYIEYNDEAQMKDIVKTCKRPMSSDRIKIVLDFYKY